MFFLGTHSQVGFFSAKAAGADKGEVRSYVSMLDLFLAYEQAITGVKREKESFKWGGGVREKECQKFGW